MGSPTLQRRILVVDDNLVNRRVTQQLLELLGYSRSCIYTANNGIEAIECLKQQVVDVVLMDLEMPVMDGMSATVEIRRRVSVRNSTALCKTHCWGIKKSTDGTLLDSHPVSNVVRLQKYAAIA